MIDIVTMKFGEKYPSGWANKLFWAVQRNLTLPYRFWCFTDDAFGLDPKIHIIQLADLGGWWNHLYAFSGWTENRQMMLDIDDLVVGSLDEMAAYKGPHALNSDVYNLQSVDGGIQLISADVTHALFDEFKENPEGTRKRFYSDKQLYIARINDSPRIQNLFPGQWVSYKAHCQGKGLPENARIVGFHGAPKPDQAGDPWIKEHWR